MIRMGKFRSLRKYKQKHLYMRPWYKDAITRDAVGTVVFVTEGIFQYIRKIVKRCLTFLHDKFIFSPFFIRFELIFLPFTHGKSVN